MTKYHYALATFELRATLCQPGAGMMGYGTEPQRPVAILSSYLTHIPLDLLN